MNIKRQLHTLFVKHDSQFKTLSKIALAEVILKIIFVNGRPVTPQEIQDELAKVLHNSPNVKDTNAAIEVLKRDNKIHLKQGKYLVTSRWMEKIRKEEAKSQELLNTVLNKYFGKAESKLDAISKWFQNTTIEFFETFSYEWFLQKTHNGKNSSNGVQNLPDLIDKTLHNAKGIAQQDKEWLKRQYIRFIDSEESDENLIFWRYGVSMFSSRIITAHTYADELSIGMFKNNKFILDTNILMVLHLEGHELNASLKALEKVLLSLNIQPVYFSITRDEYLRAMNSRKAQTIHVFDHYDLKVLEASDCPFIRTALKKGYQNERDIETMFDELMDIPDKFHNSLTIKKIEYKELEEAIEEAKSDEDLKSVINEIYHKRTNRDKRENPIEHDAGLVGGAKFLRKTDPCWVISSDSTLKLYGIQNPVRDETQLVVGLDVILGMLAVNSGGVSVEASDFAPLFKNLIKYSLIPTSEAFELSDLAFILDTHTKVNQLPAERVIEVAKEVKRMRTSGDPDETIALYLRRVIEGDKLEIAKDIQRARFNEQLALEKKQAVEKENEILLGSYRVDRKGVLTDQYDEQLRKNRRWLVGISLVCALIVYVSTKYFVTSEDKVVQYFVSLCMGVLFFLLPYLPLNKRLRRKYSERVTAVDKQIETEILQMRQQAKLS